MRLLADLHISPSTVAFLKSHGYDVVRVGDALPANASDAAIVEEARKDNRVVLTQDLDFSRIIALAGESSPSVISLRLHSARVEYVNSILARALPDLEKAGVEGVIVTIEDAALRWRHLPIA